MGHQEFRRTIERNWWRFVDRYGAKVSTIVLPTLFAGIPAAIFMAERLEVPLLASLTTVMLGSPAIRTVLFLMWLAGGTLGGFIALARWRSEVRAVPSTRHLYSLMESLNEVVGAKKRRFDGVSRDLLDSGRPFTGQEVFERITQPAQQYKKILGACWLHFRECAEGWGTPHLKVQVLLAEMGPTHVECFVDWFPSDHTPKREVQELQHSDCTLSRAKERKRLVVVDPIINEAEKPVGERLFHFVPDPETDPDADGMIICYPITEAGNDTPLVLSVHVSQAGIGGDDPDVCAMWDKVLHMFAIRLSMEYRLDQLRKAAAGRST